jgi:hypothetical protein
MHTAVKTCWLIIKGYNLVRSTHCTCKSNTNLNKWQVIIFKVPLTQFTTKIATTLITTNTCQYHKHFIIIQVICSLIGLTQTDIINRPTWGNLLKMLKPMLQGISSSKVYGLRCLQISRHFKKIHLSCNKSLVDQT